MTTRRFAKNLSKKRISFPAKSIKVTLIFYRIYVHSVCQTQNDKRNKPCQAFVVFVFKMYYTFLAFCLSQPFRRLDDS